MEDVCSAESQALPVRARALRQCPRGTLIAALHRGKEIVVVKLPDGRVFSLPDHCPHDGGRLSDGFIEGGRLVCARHGWEFDLESGSCVGRPSVQIPSQLLKNTDS